MGEIRNRREHANETIQERKSIRALDRVVVHDHDLVEEGIDRNTQSGKGTERAFIILLSKYFCDLRVRSIGRITKSDLDFAERRFIKIDARLFIAQVIRTRKRRRKMCIRDSPQFLKTKGERDR